MALLKLLNATAAVVSDRAGTVASYLYQTRELLAFFRQIGGAIDKAYSSPGAPVATPATGSPMTLAATVRQAVHLTGGTVNSLTLTRAGTGLPLAYAAVGTLVPMSPGDTLTFTYTVAPTIRALEQ